MRIQEALSMYDKLNILTDAAKYDVACTSSGTSRKSDGTGIGSCEQSGICHSFSADGRCMIVSIVSIGGAMMWRGHPLPRTRCVH